MTAIAPLNEGNDLRVKTSRRAMLGALAVAPLAVPVETMAAPLGRIASMPEEVDDEPIQLRRSAEGRSLSRVRYHNAEGFFVGVGDEDGRPMTDTLYQAGIVLQLGLSSHLLDMGFADRWCARYIGLNVARSLAYANATGLGFESADMELLTATLSPYGKWRHVGPRDVAGDFPFTMREIRTLTRALLDRVHEVTGHPRPRGWRRCFL